jgi:hypothetical protein
MFAKMKLFNNILLVQIHNEHTIPKYLIKVLYAKLCL